MGFRNQSPFSQVGLSLISIRSYIQCTSKSVLVLLQWQNDIGTHLLNLSFAEAVMLCRQGLDLHYSAPLDSLLGQVGSQSSSSLLGSREAQSSISSVHWDSVAGK